MKKSPVKSPKRPARKRKPISWVTRKPVKSLKHSRGPRLSPPLNRHQLLSNIVELLEAGGYEVEDSIALEEAERLKRSKIWIVHTYKVDFATTYDVDALPHIFSHFKEALSGHYFGKTIADAMLYSDRDGTEHWYSLGITESFHDVFSQMPDYIEAWLIPGQSGDRATVTGVQLRCTPPLKYKSRQFDGLKPVIESRDNATNRNQKRKRRRGNKAR